MYALGQRVELAVLDKQCVNFAHNEFYRNTDNYYLMNIIL